MRSTLALPLLAAGGVLSISIQEPLLALGDPPNIPPFPFPRPKPVTHTVYDLIYNNERYTKLNKAIKFVGDDFISVLNNTSHEITFFAVPDSALRPHHDDDDDDDDGHKHKHRHHHHGKHNALFNLALGDNVGLEFSLLGGPAGLKEAVELVEHIESNPGFLDDDDPDHERRKEMYRQIVKAILNYHVLPFGAYNIASLAHNTTWATNFAIPKLYGGHEQRIQVTEHYEKVEADKKKKKKKEAKENLVTRINLYAKIDEADTKTENGYVHVLNHPLLPPPAIFQEIFLAQHFFSTFTSALQRVGLTDELDIRWVKGKGDEQGHLVGSTAVTVFAPTNAAFDRLPIKLRLFLFSTFGRRVLKKLLEYHIVPNVVAHADYIFKQKVETPEVTTPSENRNLWSYLGFAPDEPVSSIKESFNTRLFNRTIDFSAEKTESKHKHRKEFKNTVFVNDRPVVMADLVAANGAFHVIDHLLSPCRKHKHDLVGEAADEWDEWETCVAHLAESD